MSSTHLRLLMPVVFAAMPLLSQVHEGEPPVDLNRGLVLSQDMKRGVEGFSAPTALKTNVGQKTFALSLLMNFPSELKETIIASQWHDAQGWRFLVTADGALRFEGRTEGKKDPILLSTAPGVIVPDSSHHLVLNVLRDATKPNAGIWVDGIEIASGVVPPVDLNPLQQFLHEPDLLAMNVACSHLRIYHRDLSRPEILALQLDATALEGPVAKHPDPPANGPRFIPQQDETIALIGGTEAVALAESGELEAHLLMAFPETRFHFRSLAWEGDTVFKQDRPLNFGSLEQQLKRVNAGTVFVMFGRQECLDAAQRTRSGDLQSPTKAPSAKPQEPEAPAPQKGASRKGNDGDYKSPLLGADAAPGIVEFKEAFGKLLDTVAKVTPNVVVIGPPPFEKKAPPLPDLSPLNEGLELYRLGLKSVAVERRLLFSDPISSYHDLDMEVWKNFTNNGVSMNEAGGYWLARCATRDFGWDHLAFDYLTEFDSKLRRRVVREVQSKNRLWHDYWRPSNWAFLHGDRTQQPSSRDPVNPQLRFFPAEQEKYLPLIKEAEEKVFKLVEEATKKLP